MSSAVSCVTVLIISACALSLFILLTFFGVLFDYPQKETVLQPKFHPVPEETVNLHRESLNLHTESLFSHNDRLGNCTMPTCFDVYRCKGDKLRVYLYPLRVYKNHMGKTISPKPSLQYLQLRNVVSNSEFHEKDPFKACLFIPPFDTLNPQRFGFNEISKVLHSLPYWNNGANHVIFGMMPGLFQIASGKSIVASSSIPVQSFRKDFDIGVPLLNPWIELSKKNGVEKRRFLVVNAAFLHNSYADIFRSLLSITPEHLREQIAVLRSCDGTTTVKQFEICTADDAVTEDYMNVLHSANFCVVFQHSPTAFTDAIHARCIPVVILEENSDEMPFSEVLDWKKASIQLYKHQIGGIFEILNGFSTKRVFEMRETVNYFYRSYFQNMKAITLTVLRILNQRIFFNELRSYESWNEPEAQRRNINDLRSTFPTFFDRAASNAGFTAVLLASGKSTSLYKSIEHLSSVKSVVKIVVLWNRPALVPPAKADWPAVAKPIRVVRMRTDLLSNRFLPLNEIETEAVFSLDIGVASMLNRDEIEFAYDVWRQFPSHLVGFPSRIHSFNESTKRFAYDSEWTNSASMVLTGAAFYHKFYADLYTTQLPDPVRKIVDGRNSCEDIAMNFLVAARTGQPVIKVTPKKKFRCAECNKGDFWVDSSHVAERSACISEFASAFETDAAFPLKAVQFRVDPFLFGNTAIPTRLKSFSGVGGL